MRRINPILPIANGNLLGRLMAHQHLSYQSAMHEQPRSKIMWTVFDAIVYGVILALLFFVAAKI